MITKTILFIFSLINKIYPKSNNKIVFVSSPDLTDNSFALFKFLIENNSDSYNYTWLIDTPDIKLYRLMIQKNISILDKNLNNIKLLDKKSIKGMLIYVQSKYIFFTHGFYTGMSVPRSQVRMNLWHGMPLKSIGYLNSHGDDTSIPKSTFTLATSETFQDIMANVFALKKEKVLLSGQPRCDMLMQKSNSLGLLGIKKQLYKKIIFWAPTYRHAMNHEIKDGSFTSHLPILKEGELQLLNKYLISIDTFMLVKLHPMDILNTYQFEQFSNLKVIKDRILLEKGCQLYSLLSEVDILITDYSSIYIDFLLLDRPIIFAMDDFESYRETRDFVFSKPLDYMPGSIVDDMKSLIAVIDDIIISKNDIYLEKRKKGKKEFHTYNNSFSARLLKQLGL